MNKILYFIIIIALLFVGFTTSCSKDEEKEKACESFELLGGDITINGSKERLSIAQFIAADVTYLFQIASVSSDCNEQKTVSFSVNVSSPGAKLDGTYTIKSFFDAETNDAHGNYSTLKISPVSQSATELASGTIKIKELGAKKYTIDLNATDILGEKIVLLLTHQF